MLGTRTSATVAGPVIGRATPRCSLLPGTLTSCGSGAGARVVTGSGTVVVVGGSATVRITLGSNRPAAAAVGAPRSSRSHPTTPSEAASMATTTAATTEPRRSTTDALTRAGPWGAAR